MMEIPDSIMVVNQGIPCNAILATVNKLQILRIKWRIQYSKKEEGRKYKYLLEFLEC